MNVRTLAAVAAVAATIVIGLSTTNWAQEKKGVTRVRLTPGKPAERFDVLFAADAADPWKTAFVDASRGGNPPLEVKIRQTAERIRDAEDAAARQAATDELTKLLDKYFEEDMKARTEELKDVQQRLANLQAQLERRRAKKQEIVDLQMKVALNEADGLGFYSQPKGAVFTFGAPGKMVQEFPVALPQPVRVELPSPPPAPAFMAAPAAASAPAATSTPMGAADE
jgi:hypothetical protein